MWGSPTGGPGCGVTYWGTGMFGSPTGGPGCGVTYWWTGMWGSPTGGPGCGGHLLEDLGVGVTYWWTSKTLTSVLLINVAIFAVEQSKHTSF